MRFGAWFSLATPSAPIFSPFYDSHTLALRRGRHTMEHMWGVVLKKQGTVLRAGWPEAAAPDFVLQQAARCGGWWVGRDSGWGGF